MFPVKLVCKNFLKGERKKGKEGRDIRASFSSFPFIYNGFRFEKGGDGKKMDFIRIFHSSNMCSLLLLLFCFCFGRVGQKGPILNERLFLGDRKQR